MKKMLVIEEPESCETCPLRSYSDLMLMCTPMREPAYSVECPLRPLPKKKEVHYTDPFFGEVENLTNIGYNRCLVDLGET